MAGIFETDLLLVQKNLSTGEGARGTYAPRLLYDSWRTSGWRQLHGADALMDSLLVMEAITALEHFKQNWLTAW